MEFIKCPACGKDVVDTVSQCQCGHVFRPSSVKALNKEKIMTTETTNSGKKPLIGRCGALVALLALLFLPIAGCEDVGMTGMEAIGSDDLSGDIRFCVILCIACAAVGIAAKPSRLCFWTGGVGIASILIGYALVRRDVPAKLMMGGYLAIMGYIALLVEGGRQKSKTNSEQPNTDSGAVAGPPL